MINNYINESDLDYLAKRGLEDFDNTDLDISELTYKIENRFNSSNLNFFFSCIGIGLFLGLTLIFSFVNKDLVTPTRLPLQSSNVLENKLKRVLPIVLDTIVVIAEPFQKTKDSTDLDTGIESHDTIMVANMPQITYSLEKETVNEMKLTYSPNAPFRFIHNLKVTGFQEYYFKKQFYTPATKGNLMACYSNSVELQRSKSPLKNYQLTYLNEWLADGLNYFNDKNYTTALYYFSELLKQNPEDINALFYTGLCNYHLGYYNAAIQNFSSVISHKNNNFLLESDYYKALSLLGNEQYNEGKLLLNKISEEGHFYAKPATQLLEKL